MNSAQGDSPIKGTVPLAAVGLLVGNLLLHKPVSDVCDALFARIGRGPYELITLSAIAALSLAGVVLLLVSGGRTGLPTALRRLTEPRRAVALLGLLAAMAAAQRWLLVSNVELIHFPQFGLLAALLLATGLSPQTAWWAATAGGALDEAYQRLVIYPAVPNVYFDWNDIVLNALGAALAVVVAAPASSFSRQVRRALLAVGLLACALAFVLAPPNGVAMASFPFWQPVLGHALTGRDYHVMPASEGIAVLLLIWSVVGFATAPPSPGGRGQG